MATQIATPRVHAGADYTAIVQHYILHQRAKLHNELHYFSSQPSLDLAIHEAVRAVDHRGKRLSHQRRLHTHVIPMSLPLMAAAKKLIARSNTFDELMSTVENILNAVPRAGDLYRYDTSLRIGSYLGLYPTRVFLQTGAYDGARKISKDFRERSVSLAQFPAPFHALAPFELENLLCVYKDNLQPRQDVN